MNSIKIQNFGGCIEFNVNHEFGSPLLITGKNGAGKSSVVTAIQCAALAESLPVGVLKKEANQVTLNGMGDCEVSLNDTTFSLPDCSVEGDPVSNVVCVGQTDLQDMDAKQFSKFLGNVLGAEPTDEQIRIELEHLPKATIDQVIKRVREKGWDTACTSYESTGRTLKGQWAEATGQNYGKAKAENFFPDGYDPELDELHQDDLDNMVRQAKDELEGAIASDAISMDERQRIEEISQRDEIDFSADEKLMNETIKEMKELDEKIKSSNQDKHDAECPNCGVKLKVSGKSVKAFISGEIVDTAEMTKDLVNLKRLVDELNSKVMAGKRFNSEIFDAMQQLVNFPEISETRIDTKLARESLERAELRAKAKKSKFRADQLHGQISEIVDIVLTLRADGIRAKALKNSLSKFNGLINKIAPDWAIKVDEKNNWRAYGRMFTMLSTSEKLFVKFVCRVAVALLSGAKVICLDAADMFDEDHDVAIEEIALKAAKKIDLVVVAMTRNTKGSGYFLQGGKIV